MTQVAILSAPSTRPANGRTATSEHSASSSVAASPCCRAHSSRGSRAAPWPAGRGPLCAGRRQRGLQPGAHHIDLVATEVLELRDLALELGSDRLQPIAEQVPDAGEPGHDPRPPPVARLDVGVSCVHEGGRRGVGPSPADSSRARSSRMRPRSAGGVPGRLRTARRYLHRLAMGGDPRGRSCAGERGRCASSLGRRAEGAPTRGSRSRCRARHRGRPPIHAAAGVRPRGSPRTPRPAAAGCGSHLAVRATARGRRARRARRVVGRGARPAARQSGRRPTAGTAARRRRRPRRSPARVRAMRKPLEHRGLDRLGHVGCPDVVRRRHRAVREHAHELLDVDAGCHRCARGSPRWRPRHRAAFQQDPGHDARLLEGQAR